MIQIPEDFYEFRLERWISDSRNVISIESDKALLEFLSRLVTCSMEESDNSGTLFIGRFNPSDDDIKVIHNYSLDECQNFEIKAYSLDLLQQWAKDKREPKKLASTAYLDLYRETHSSKFLLRAISIRSIKILNNTAFVTQVSKCMTNVYWFPKICTQLRKSYTVEELCEVRLIIEENIEKFSQNVSSTDRRPERRCYEALSVLGIIDSCSLHRLLALSYEKEVDVLNAETDSNVIHMNIQQIAQNACKEISLVKDNFREDYNRIRNKLIVAQKNMAKIIEMFGVKTTFSISDKLKTEVTGILKDKPLVKPVELVGAILSVPFFIGDQYNSLYQSSKDCGSILNDSFGSCQVGSQGQILGSSDPENALKIRIHKYLRFNQRYVIWAYMADFLQNAEEWDEEDEFLKIVQSCTSKYIPEDRRRLWADGFVLMISGKLIASIHMLMPQIEHLLLRRAESYLGPQTKLEGKSHQDEPSFERCLRLLEPHFKEHFYDEFRFFFIDGADSNVRNRMAHGLCDVHEMLDIAPYLCWLAMKLYWHENDIFL